MITIQSVDVARLGGFIPVPRFVARDHRLSDGAKLAYGQILFMGWHGGDCQSLQKDIGDELGVTDRQVRRLLAELQGHGYLGTQRHGQGLPNSYELLIPTPDQSGNLERTDMSGLKFPDRTDMSGLERTDMSGPSLEIEKEEEYNTYCPSDPSSTESVRSDDEAEAARLEQSKNCPVCRGRCLPNCRHACHGKPDLKPAPRPKKTRQFRPRNSGPAPRPQSVAPAFVPEPWLADFETAKREATGTGFSNGAQRAQAQLAEPRKSLGHEKTLACYRAFLAGADPQWRAMGCFVRDVTAWDPAKKNGAGKAKAGGAQAYLDEVLAKAKAKRAAKEAA